MSQATVRRSVSFSVAKDHLSALAREVNETGEVIVVTRHAKPWVEIRPVAHRPADKAPVVISPVRQPVIVPDLDELFAGYEGSYVPEEDGFANPVGDEEL